MNTKLFLGIIIIFAVISGILLPIVEGVCNYEDDSEQTGVQKGDSSGSSGSGDSSGSSGSGYSLAGKGAPVKNRSSDSCTEAGVYQNEQRIKLAQVKLNELKSIYKRTQEKVYNNTNQIVQNLNNRSKMNSLVDDKDKSAKNDACKKYPEAC